MMRAGLVFAAALVVYLGVGWNGPRGPAPALAASETEDELINRGVKMRKAGNDQEAADVFAQAHDRFRTPRAAAQRGLAEQALGRWEDAEAHLTEALRAENDPWIRKNLDTLTRAMTVIKGHLARVEILGEPPGAEILVNGRAAGRLPLSGAVSTSAGEVDVEARAAGFKREVRKLTLVGGQYQRLVIRLEKEGSGSPGTATGTTAPSNTTTLAQPTPPPPDQNGTGGYGTPAGDAGTGEKSTSDVRPVLKWTALGLAVGSLGVGIVSSYVRSSRLSEFNAAKCMDNNGKAVDAGGNPVQACQDDLDTYNTARKYQIGGFVAAGIFAAAWAVLFFTEPSNAPATARNTTPRHLIACSPSADLRGASCAFRF
jgi:hypothetical protein